MVYKGADIEKINGQYWIIHDAGKTGPFASHDIASNECNCNDEEPDHPDLSKNMGYSKDQQVYI